MYEFKIRCWRPPDFWRCLLSLTLDAVLKTPPLDLRRERCCHRVLAGRINYQRINNYMRSFRKKKKKKSNTSIHSDDNSLNTACFFFPSPETWLTCFSKLLKTYFLTRRHDGDTIFFFSNLCLITEWWVLHSLGNDWREILGSLLCCVSVFLPLPSRWRMEDSSLLPSFLPSFLPQVRFLHS